MKKLVRVLIVVIMIATMILPVKNLALATPEPEPQYLYISELPVGSLVVDNSMQWAYRTGTNYSGSDNYDHVVWRIVAKNHPGYPANSVTLLSEWLVAKWVFDNSTNRGSDDGCARWDISGTDNATMGIRPWLADVFFESALSADFKNKVLTTTVSTDTRFDTDDNWAVDNPVRTYTTADTIFLPSWNELVSVSGSTPLEWFAGDIPDSMRIGYFPDGSSDQWWTRSETLHTGDGTLSHFAVIITSMPKQLHVAYANGSWGIRPMLNLADDVLVRAEPNLDGYHEIVWDVVAETTDSDLDGIYFAGDTLSFNIYNLPANENVRVYFLVNSFLDAEIESAPVLTGLDHEEILGVDVWYTEATTDERGMLSVSGQVSSDLPLGEFLIGIASGSLGVDALPVETLTAFGKVIVGLPLVWGDYGFNFDLIDNLWDFTQEVWVTVGDIGRITFNAVVDIDGEFPGLPPLIYAEVMLIWGDSWLDFTWNSEEKQFSIGVDSEKLTWLAENGATIEIYDFASRVGVEGMTATNFLNYLDIKVYGNDGELVADISGYLDISAITYDPVEDVLTIPVNHFSEYVFALKSLPVTGTNYWYILPSLLLMAGGLWVIRRYVVGSDA